MPDPDTIEYTPFTEYHVKKGDTLASIAQKNGLTWQDLSNYNFGTAVPNEVNRCLHEYIGCSQKTKDGKNFVFSDEDVPGIIYIPKPPKPFKLSTGEYHKIKVKRPILFSRVEVQTVDDMGQRVKNVTLKLHPDNGLPDETITSDGNGYGKLDKVRAGKYQVLLDSGEPAWMFDPTKTSAPPAEGEEPDDDDKLVEAHIETNNHLRAITRIVVAKTATPEWREQNKLLKESYARTGEETSLEGRGKETTGKTPQSSRYCADNLALAAGWTDDGDLNQKKLVSTVLKGFLRDYHPTAIARKYHVLMLGPATKTLVLVNADGTVEKEFKLAPGLDTVGLIGAYAVFENVGGTLFVDMATMSTIVSVPSMPDGIDVEQIVTDPPALHTALAKHAGEVQILYYTPTGAQLGGLAVIGGTGMLENYGTDSAVNDDIHERNIAVCKSIKRGYEAYAEGYIKKVKATHNEDELRKLGPPRSPYQMPTPAGATDQQISDIFNAQNVNELDMWHAIAVQLDHFANRLSQGYPFLRIKPKFVATPKNINKITQWLRPGLPQISEKVPGEVEFELNFDLQVVDGDVETLVKGDAVIKGKLKLDETVKKLTGNKVPVEISFKQSTQYPEKRSLTVRIGNYQIEKDTVGKTKLAFQTAPGVWLESEMNTRSGMFGGAVSFKGKDLASKLKGKGPRLDKVAGFLENFEIQFQLGFVGTREETVLAAISHGPGFFERRSLKELLDPKTQWVNLSADEQAELVALGWYAAIWDGKYHKENKDKLPESLKQSRDELSDTAKIAIVHLGFYAYEDYGKAFKKSVNEFSDYVY
jgi:hypothetical protein